MSRNRHAHGKNEDELHEPYLSRPRRNSIDRCNSVVPLPAHEDQPRQPPNKAVRDHPKARGGRETSQPVPLARTALSFQGDSIILIERVPGKTPVAIRT